jgi:hypothetical protein
MITAVSYKSRLRADDFQIAVPDDDSDDASLNEQIRALSRQLARLLSQAANASPEPLEAENIPQGNGRFKRRFEQCTSSRDGHGFESCLNFTLSLFMCRPRNAVITETGSELIHSIRKHHTPSTTVTADVQEIEVTVERFDEGSASGASSVQSGRSTSSRAEFKLNSVTPKRSPNMLQILRVTEQKF